MHRSVSARAIHASPAERVLEHLDGVRRSGKGWTARCPAHEDHWPSLSVSEGRDGRALLTCHAGCAFDDLIRALGLELRDLFPPRDDSARPQPRRTKPAPYVMPRETAGVLLGSDRFAIVWELGKALAGVEPRQARADVVAAWDALTLVADPRLILRTAALLRGVALFGHCSSGRCEPEDVTRAVRRLCRNLERGEAA